MKINTSEVIYLLITVHNLIRPFSKHFSEMKFYFILKTCKSVITKLYFYKHSLITTLLKED